MKHFVALAFFVVSVSLTGQVQHAPTVAQCQADQRLWFSQLEDTSNSKMPDFYTELDEEREMGDCQKVDPPNSVRYYNTGSEMAAERTGRVESFVQRHGLWAKFIEEDKAGMR